MNIALVELSKSHEECLYSQVLFLQDKKHKVHLFLNPNLIPQVASYGLEPDHVFPLRQVYGLFKKVHYAYSFAKKLAVYDKVVFNTASSSKLLRNTVLFLNFFKVDCYGVLHNTKKLSSSFTQRLISTKIKNYFVLNDHLQGNPVENTKISLQSFYPIYFPNFKALLKKPKDQVWIVIPGAIEYARRDYDKLLNCLEKNRKLKELKIILLGRLDPSTHDAMQLMTSIAKKGLTGYFKTFENFIPNEEFHAFIKKADYIMPLLVKNEDYLKHKITGAFNLAFAYKKPLLTDSFFEPIPDLKENSIFYDEHTLYNLLESLSVKEYTIDSTYTHKKWSFGVQRDRFNTFLFSQ